VDKRTDNQIDKSVAGWFLTLRWGTVLCQVLLFSAVRFLFAVAVPGLVFGLIAFEVISNLIFAWLIREQKRVPGPLFTGAMFLDIALLTALLALTGGAMNPFTFLYLVHVVVGAILLPKAMAWGLAAFASACYGVFFWPALHFTGPSVIQPLCHTEPAASEVNLHLQGMWLAFVITAFFVVFFVTRIQQALVAHRDTRAQLREEQLKNERLASLATLSAGAAHEFATPLATIAVAAGELYREMEQGGNELWLEDLRLIRSQVSRCRDILHQMAADAGEPLGEGQATLPLIALLHEVKASLDEQRQARLVITCPCPEPLITVPRRSVQRILRGLVSNAFQASDPAAPVTLRAELDQGMARFTIIDQGRGMDPETVARATDPFFTTKPVGQGLGLGLYLAATLAERLGGGLTIHSTPGAGTTVRFWFQQHESKENNHGKR
jgi:two-component system sensor histidine kinase RegB